MLLSLDLNIDDILRIPDESLEILNIQGDERFDVKLEIQNEDDLFNEDDFKVFNLLVGINNYSGAAQSLVQVF